LEFNQNEQNENADLPELEVLSDISEEDFQNLPNSHDRPEILDSDMENEPLFEDFEEKYFPPPNPEASSSNQPVADSSNLDTQETVLSRGGRSTISRKRRTLTPFGPSLTILDETWYKEYNECPYFGEEWKQAMSVQQIVCTHRTR